MTLNTLRRPCILPISLPHHLAGILPSYPRCYATEGCSPRAIACVCIACSLPTIAPLAGVVGPAPSHHLCWPGGGGAGGRGTKHWAHRRALTHFRQLGAGTLCNPTLLRSRHGLEQHAEPTLPRYTCSTDVLRLDFRRPNRPPENINSALDYRGALDG